MACMCGATDCPSCGPAQGYTVVRIYNYKTRRYEYVNPDEDCDEEPPDENNMPDEEE